MPATTRSSKQQKSLEDVGVGQQASKGGTRRGSSATATASKKRKAADDSGKTAKKSKVSPPTKAEEKSSDGDDGTIVINRAPVLELWAACVTQFLYPSVAWSTCLSAGGAVSTITAISKGRSIGKIDKPDPGEADKKRQQREDKAEREHLDELEVMSFKLNIGKDGQALVGGKPKKGNEEALQKKYGGSQAYDSVKKAFQNALKEWKGQEEELDSRGFGIYEDFRPSIPAGQKGWGRKGNLNLETVKSAIAKV